MPKFCANLTYLFKEYPFLERFEAAAEAGFEGVEVLFPYDDAVKELISRLRRAELPLVLINAPPPNWTGGERGFAAVPGLEGRFRMDFRRTIRFAERLKPLHIHLMAGVAEGEDARRVFVENLRWAADEAPKQSLTIEPLNPTDMPGYFLNDFSLAAEILAEVDRPNVALQYDAYHAHMIHGDAVAVWKTHSDLAKHIQLGASPGRVEPHRGDLDLPSLFEAIAETGYDGFIAGEYIPQGKTLEGLDWMKA